MNDDGKIEIEVRGFQAEQVVEYIGDALMERLKAKLDDAVKEAVARAVDKIVTARVEAVVAAEADRVLVEGWEIFNRYGESTGKKETLRQRVLGWFDVKGQYDRETQLAQLIQRTAQEMIEKTCKEQMAAVSKAFREQVDGILAGHVTKSLRDALGVR